MLNIRRPLLRKLIHKMVENKEGDYFKDQFLLEHFKDIYVKSGGEKSLDPLISKLMVYHFEPDGNKILTALRELAPEDFEAAYAEVMGDNTPISQSPSPIKSEKYPRHLGINSRSEALAYMRNAHALVIGIADYVYLSKLDNTLNDAGDIAATLTDDRKCGYPRNQVKLVRDAEATKERIESELQALAKTTDTSSTVFIFFAGHGGRIESGSNAGHFLLPVDTKGRKRFGEAAYVETAISAHRFSQLLSQIPANKLIVVLDCCYSGGVASLSERARSEEQLRDEEEGVVHLPSEEMLDELVNSGRGRVILAATDRRQTAKELLQDRNGLFTKHLLEGLAGAGGGPGYLVSVFEVYQYVHGKVSAMQLTSPQTPSFKADLESPIYLAVRSLDYLQA